MSLRAGMLRAAFAVYKRGLSPMLHAVGVSQCIFLPTCSEYAYVAMLRYGFWRGGALAVRRGQRARVSLRVHQDIVLNSSALLDGGGTVLVLPAKTRYEQDGGGTSTNTERRVRFSPQIPGAPLVGEARAEWKIFDDLGEAMTRRGFARAWRSLATGQAVRAEMDHTAPRYRGGESEALGRIVGMATGARPGTRH